MTDPAPPPDRNGGGFARQPEQQEKIHTGLVESITIPWQRAIKTCTAGGLICLCVYVIIACVWFWKRSGAWHRVWYEPWLDLFEGIGRIWPLLLIPWVVLCLFVWLASYLGNIVQVLNEKWWPVLTAYDPGEYGLLGILFGRRRKREETTTQDLDVEEPERVWRVEVPLVSEDGARGIYARFGVPDSQVENWMRFCEAVAKPESLLTPRFSKAGARRFHIPWDVFRLIQSEFLARGLAYQDPSRNGSGQVHLLAAGRTTCRKFATTPPPQF